LEVWWLKLTRKSTPDFCSRAQSNGECPGSNVTFRLLLLLGFPPPAALGRVNPLPAATPDAPAPITASRERVAGVACWRARDAGDCGGNGCRFGSGGGAIDIDILGDNGGGMERLERTDDARWAELIAGKGGGRSSSSALALSLLTANFIFAGDRVEFFSVFSSNEIAGMLFESPSWTGRAFGVVSGDS
jgi:hypothetical protein